MPTDTVTTSLHRPGAVDEAAYAKFLAKNTRSNMRARDKANARGDSRALWFGYTDAECAEAARSYCAMYRHQFRVLVQVEA